MHVLLLFSGHLNANQIICWLVFYFMINSHLIENSYDNP